MYSDQLLQEMENYGKMKKAEIVHRKCLRVKKFALARKIAKKYKLEFKHDDMITSFEFALSSLNR